MSSELKKLQMPEDNKTEGDFVKTLQGQTGVGYEEGTHVHKDWWATTLSYEEGMELAQRAVDEREDLLVPAGDISGVVYTPTSVNGESSAPRFAFHVKGKGHYVPTDHALKDFSTKAALPSTSFMRVIRGQHDFDAQDAKLMADSVNNWIRRVDPEKLFQVRTYKDGTMRSFLSEKYAVVDNRWFIETMQDLLPQGRLSHWTGGDDAIYGNILLPDTIMDYDQDDSDYSGMLSVGNSEIGTRQIEIDPSIFRSICLNGCIWGRVSGVAFSRRHIGDIDLDGLKVSFAENIAAQLPILDTGVHKFLATRELGAKAVPMKSVIASVAKTVKLSRGEATKVLDEWSSYESADRNLFGVVNAITRAGQTCGNARWHALDKVAGQIIDWSPGRWDVTLQDADVLKDKDLEKIYAPVAVA